MRRVTARPATGTRPGFLFTSCFLGLLYPVNQPKLVIEKPPTPLLLPTPLTPSDTNTNLPPVLPPVRPPPLLQEDQQEQTSQRGNNNKNVDVSHKFEKLFEDDEIFSDLEDFENFEIVIREIPENFEDIKEAFKTTPVSGLTIPALAEKFMADLEKKEKDFKDETEKIEKDVPVIDLSEVDLFEEFGSEATQTIKDKRNQDIFIVCISLSRYVRLTFHLLRASTTNIWRRNTRTRRS